MGSNELSRRDFLRTTSVLATTVAAGGTIIFGPDHAWALSTTSLDGHTAQTLLIMARQLFPHDRVEEQYYAAVIEAVDKEAASNAALRKLLTDGVAQLDRGGGPWMERDEGARETALKSIDGSEFFSAMRTRTINNLYGNPAVFKLFGFGGSSVEYGGYIDRGFNDIDWLPAS